MTGLLDAFVKIPDELTLSVSHFAAVTGRKAAEHQMHRYLTKTPEMD